MHNSFKLLSKNFRKSFIRCDQELNKSGIFRQKKIFVPGIFEIPFVISKNIKGWDAFLALGCVIKGKTPHFNLISKATTSAIMNLSVEHKKPIGNGIITCLNRKQANERSSVGKKNKGSEAAKAVIALLKL